MTSAPDPTGVRWYKSTRSAANGACVEVARFGAAVGVRDSKDPESPVLRFTANDWQSFLATAKRGSLDIRA